MLSWMKRRVDQENERGATMLLVTVSMVMLLLFGAFAVDLGAAWSQRRENQAAVDPGGMAAALETRGKTQAVAIADADAEVMRITYNSIDPDMPFSDWVTAWTLCADPAKDPKFTVTGSSDCISYTNSLSTIRVKTPLVDTDTTFASIIGLDTLQTDAFVEVTIGLEDRGQILPFGLPGTSAGANEVCLKTGTQPIPTPPCDGPDDGNFGFLDIAEYGNEPFGTITTCSGAVGLLERNIARGVDHPILSVSNPAAPYKHDIDGCLPNPNLNYGPHTMSTAAATGDKAQVVTDGLVRGTSNPAGGTLTGRLTQSTDTISTAQGNIDDKPLWEYLNGAGQTFCGTVNNHDEMADCLQKMRQATGNTNNYFLDSLGDSARFAWVPLFHNLVLGPGGSVSHNIKEFRPIYLQTTFWKCEPGGCDAVHDPGEPLQGTIKGGNGFSINALTSLQIPRKNLPDKIDDGFFGKGSETLYAIVE
jgi:Flp pilus assembly protein TadG